MRKVTSSSSSLLHSSEQVEDSRVVHVLLEGQSLRETKRIPVTFQETVTSLIRRALDQNLLQHEDVDNFELLYMMSEDEKIKVSDHSLVCLSMNLGVQYFIVRKRPQVKGKEFSESTCKSSRPLSHKQVGDTCLIRVHLETQSPEMAKSVLVTCQDRAPVVIRSALDLHFLTEENPEDYELGQIISRRQSAALPLSFLGLHLTLQSLLEDERSHISTWKDHLEKLGQCPYSAHPVQTAATGGGHRPLWQEGGPCSQQPVLAFSRIRAPSGTGDCAPYLLGERLIAGLQT
ncbi:uncharacterized protein LOC144251276 [Urocitellus parryii]